MCLFLFHLKLTYKPDPSMGLTEETMSEISLHDYKLIIEDKEMRMEHLEKTAVKT